MLKEHKRICDVCGEEITSGTKYRKSTMPADAATLLATADDPDLIPTWTINADGTITMDICLECEISTGTAEAEGPSH